MMSKFLANLGAALRTPGLGDRLQAALAAAGGDTNALMRLRALQLQRAEQQRQNDARDAQVIGAKNLGFSNDEIGAMGAQDLSLAARQRIASQIPGPSTVPDSPPAGEGAGPALGVGAAQQGGALASLPRARTPAHAAALAKGTAFIAPDGSIRRKI
jgi:hypothetical protein